MKKVNFHALLTQKCLQVFIQLDQAVTKAWLGAKSTIGAEVCAQSGLYHVALTRVKVEMVLHQSTTPGLNDRTAV